MVRRVEQSSVVLAVLLCFAFGYYISNIGGGLNVDEVWHAEAGYALVGKGNIFFWPNVIAHPPLWRYVIGTSQLAFGRESLGVRFPSVIFAVLTIATLYWLCREIWGRLVGLIASFALLFSPFFGTFAVEGTPDMAGAFFSGTLLLLGVLILKTGISTRRVVLIGLFTGLALGDSYQMVAIALPVLLTIYGFRESRPSMTQSCLLFLAGFGTLALTFAPYLPTPIESARYFLSPLADLPGYASMFSMMTPWAYLQSLRDYTEFSLYGLVLGHALLLLRRTRARLLLLFAADTYLLAIALVPVRYARYLLPLLLPTTALLFGFTADLTLLFGTLFTVGRIRD